jgi:hypothetical protein
MTFGGAVCVDGTGPFWTAPVAQENGIAKAVSYTAYAVHNPYIRWLVSIVGEYVDHSLSIVTTLPWTSIGNYLCLFPKCLRPSSNHCCAPFYH